MTRSSLLLTLFLSSALSSQGAETENLNTIGGGGLVEGSGSALMPGPGGTVLTLTGGVLASSTKDTVTVNGKTISVTSATRICAKNGARTSLKALPIGEKVLVVSLAGESNAQTIRVGPMLSKLTKSGDLERVNNYACK
ncbi:MAG: hypothetical protein U1E89_22310 [Burkholderiaceae bacterium]